MRDKNIKRRLKQLENELNSLQEAKKLLKESVAIINNFKYNFNPGDESRNYLENLHARIIKWLGED
jgi:hypothetical protein